MFQDSSLRSNLSEKEPDGTDTNVDSPRLLDHGMAPKLQVIKEEEITKAATFTTTVEVGSNLSSRPNSSKSILKKRSTGGGKKKIGGGGSGVAGKRGGAEPAVAPKQRRPPVTSDRLSEDKVG